MRPKMSACFLVFPASNKCKDTATKVEAINLALGYAREGRVANIPTYSINE